MPDVGSFVTCSVALRGSIVRKDGIFLFNPYICTHTQRERDREREQEREKERDTIMSDK